MVSITQSLNKELLDKIRDYKDFQDMSLNKILSSLFDFYLKYNSLSSIPNLSLLLDNLDFNKLSDPQYLFNILHYNDILTSLKNENDFYKSSLHSLKSLSFSDKIHYLFNIDYLISLLTYKNNK